MRKAIKYGVAVMALIVLAVLWRPFAGRVGVVLGLTAAGVAFAMQEVIGALAGSINILSGRIFRVGDRIEMGGVRGDVIDIAPLRTRSLEIGSASDDATWVKGRQHTGRIVAVSNKATFTHPVSNFPAAFDFIWEELTLPIPYDGDWRRAETIMREEATRVSASTEARAAIDSLAQRFPVPRTELEPQLFVRATDNPMELAARFVVPVRTARAVKDEVTRRVQERLERDRIEVASQTIQATVRRPGDDEDGAARRTS